MQKKTNCINKNCKSRKNCKWYDKDNPFINDPLWKHVQIKRDSCSDFIQKENKIASWENNK